MAWEFMSASVAGTSHLATGKLCEDHSYVGMHTSGALIAIVADGVGSAAQGGLGAKLAVQAVSSYLQSLSGVFSPQTMFAHLEKARSNAMSEIRANRLGEAASEFATTLSAVWIAESYAAAIHIGDGFGVVASRESTPYAWRTWLVPQRGEYANETSVLHDCVRDSNLTLWESRVDAFCLSTDGMLKVALVNNTQPHAPFFNALLRTGMTLSCDVRDAKLAGFLMHEHVTSRTDDDTTLVVAWRTEGR